MPDSVIKYCLGFVWINLQPSFVSAKDSYLSFVRKKLEKGTSNYLFGHSSTESLSVTVAALWWSNVNLDVDSINPKIDVIFSYITA